MDSIATLQIPATCYGIRYDYGIFAQVIKDGWQAEVTDTWLHFGNPWEIRRPNIVFEVKVGGHTEQYHDEKGRLRVRWLSEDQFRGVAHDTPVPGYGVNTVNLLRLWSAEASESFDFQAFNQGDYVGAVMRKVRCENISKVLYPNDEAEGGKRLRLIQQYFFVTCALQDMLRILFATGQPLERFAEKSRFSSTTPTPPSPLPIMRLLVDVHGMEWEPAWEITADAMAYTNHTLLPEALEKWPLPLQERAATPPGDHLRDQRPLSRRLASALPRRPGAHLPAFDHRGGTALREHGQAGMRRQHGHQRRRRTA